MRMTFIRDDAVMTVDGVSKLLAFDASFLPDVHAIQWYEDHGEVEQCDPQTKKMTANVDIISLTDCQALLDMYAASTDPYPPIPVEPATIPVTTP